MLYLISLGIWDVKDMSLKAFEVLKNSDVVYLEVYTSKSSHTKEHLEKLIGKKVILLSREILENNAERLVEEGRHKNISICAQGDILSATTHSYFLKIAKENGIDIKVVHGSSIFTSVAKTGLSLYRFGRVVSLPHPKNFPTYPLTPFKRIENNYYNDLHTLVLLDIRYKVYDALPLLKQHLSFLKENYHFFACYALGSEDENIIYGSFEKLKEKTKKWKDYAQCIVIPSKMEFYEEEIARIWR